MEISGHSRVFALLGDPVSHSLSPVMQNAAFRALGLDAAYVAMRCDSTQLGALMETLARQGGGGNVTIPHKQQAAEVLGRNGSPQPAGATCNTFWGRDGRLEGTETDSKAILVALHRMGTPGAKWLLVGTGGSALAALSAAKRAGADIAVRSRSPLRATEFEQLARGQGIGLAEVGACDVVLNCTPLGLNEGDPLPIDPSATTAGGLALDLVYRPGETAWVRAMRSVGWTAADGREVLLEQGAAAFEHWFPDRPAPREVMRAALRFALG